MAEFQTLTDGSLTKANPISSLFDGGTETLDNITEERNSFTFDDGNVGSVHTLRAAPGLSFESSFAGS